MKPLWQSREQAEDTAERLRKFGQPPRLMILSLLLQGKKSVSEIDVATGIGQPGLSQQLAVAQKQVFYSLADESVELSVRSIEAVFGAGDPRVALHLGVKPLEARPQSDTVAGAANSPAFADRAGPSTRRLLGIMRTLTAEGSRPLCQGNWLWNG